MTQHNLTDADLAPLYRVTRKQIGRWRLRGLDLLRPGIVLEALAAQPHPGATFDRLIQPGMIRATETAINCVIQGKEIPPALTKIITT